MNPQLVIHNYTFNWGERTYVMGILNITPDSFSGDGLLANISGSKDEQLQKKDDRREVNGIAVAVDLAKDFVSSGVDILDVGGESTRPGAEPITADEELERVIPVIQALTQHFDIVISIDTYKAEVAEAALRAGAHLVNDVWALRADPVLAKVVAEHNVPIILMHNRSNPSNAELRERLGGRYIGVKYEDLLKDVMESVDVAHQAGIPDEHIILDPGIGFGKTVEQNLKLLNRLDEIRDLGYPVLLGPSRKSFIGYTLDLPPNERVEGTAATVAVGIVRGADIVRVHDPGVIVRVSRMTDAIVR